MYLSFLLFLFVYFLKTIFFNSLNDRSRFSIVRYLCTKGLVCSQKCLSFTVQSCISLYKSTHSLENQDKKHIPVVIPSSSIKVQRFRKLKSDKQTNRHPFIHPYKPNYINTKNILPETFWHLVAWHPCEAPFLAVVEVYKSRGFRTN